MFKNTLKENLHHTIICTGNANQALLDIDSLIGDFTKQSMRVERILYQLDKLLLEDAENIFSRHVHKVGENQMQFVILSFNSTNFQTQNSILKILEEPPRGVHFFLIVQNKKILLPTILSRAQIFEYTKEIEISKETKDFIKASYAKRLEITKKLVDDLKNEKITKQSIIDFIEEIEKYVHGKKNIELLKKVIQVKEYAKEQGASIKQLLEFLAITVTQ